MITLLLLLPYLRLGTSEIDPADIPLDDQGIDFSDWMPVTREAVDFELNKEPIQVKTTSRLGSDDQIDIVFQLEDTTASLIIHFGDSISYFIEGCTEAAVRGNPVPRAVAKMWTLRKLESAIVIECNDVLVLEYTFVSSGVGPCEELWSQDVSYFFFEGADTASKEFRIVGEDEFESSCASSSCYPRWGNLLKGRRVTSTSTCGLDGPEEYCLLGNEREEIMCDICDDNSVYQHHPPNYMKDRRVKSKTTWWMAKTGVDEVTLQLDLETMFQFTHLMMVFYSFRPGAMVIERSIDYGTNWQPYQYFAYDCQKVFGMQERELGAPDEYGVERHPDEDVICTSKYSYFEPAQGGEVIYKVIRGRPTTNTNRVSLRNLLLLTNLRVRFVKLHTLGDEILDRYDSESMKKYFYAVEDWVVRGSCFCNGHSDTCSTMPGMEGASSIRNMVHGRCECAHNTEGNNCERCKPFYHALPWGPGDPTTGQPQSCKACGCNGHSTTCEFDEQLFSSTGDGGRCLNCEHSTAGAHCDRCVYGYYQTEGVQLSESNICQPCNCDEAGTSSEICASVTEGNVLAGTCMCKENVAATMKCDTCKEDHYGISADNPLGCTACDCDTRGTIGEFTTCDIVTGQCLCKDNVAGKACDRCEEGYFNMMSDNAAGCEQCQCDTIGSADPHSCDPLTGTCYCKKGFFGYSCDEIMPGFFIPSLDHWNYNPEDSATISGDGYAETAVNSSGTGYVILPPDSSIEQNTDVQGPIGLQGDKGDINMVLPTGLYDLKVYHEPAESDYQLTLQIQHFGKYDGTQALPYNCAIDADNSQSEQPYQTQTITIKIRAGSTVTRLEDMCLDEGSQYDLNLALGDGGSAPLLLRDLVIVEPVEPEKAFPENPALMELWREYQELDCPLSETSNTDIDNECFRIKREMEEGVEKDDVAESCETTVCLPDLDIWDFQQDGSEDVSMGGDSKVVVKEGGDVRIPARGSMTVPLDPGVGGLREVLLGHGELERNNLITADVTIRHMGNKDGSTPKSYRCNGRLIRPYTSTSLQVRIKKRKTITTIADICLDPEGDYLVTITPEFASEAPDFIVKQVYVVPPDMGEEAFPNSPIAAQLWDDYLNQDCPKVAGLANHNNEQCIAIMNQINELASSHIKAITDCSRKSCIPYNPVWGAGDPIDNLSGGSYVNPETNNVVLPDSSAVVELPVQGADSITGSHTNLVMKHEPVEEAQVLLIQLIRTDSDEPYSCGVLEAVPATQTVETTLLPGANTTLITSFCMDPEGEYEIRLSGAGISEPIKIQEIGSALPSDPDIAYPANPEASKFYEQYLNQGCDQFPSAQASQDCVHIANLIDYHSDPKRQSYQDCTVEFCFPSKNVFSPAVPGTDLTLTGGASQDPTEGTLDIPAGGKASAPLHPLITGPNTVVIQYGDLLADPQGDLPEKITVTITYRGTNDGTTVGEINCRGETTKPATITYEITINPAKNRVEFEACLVENGNYQIQISVDQDETDSSLPINKVQVELPRDTRDLFEKNEEAAELVDFLVATCENQVFSAECAVASRDVLDAIKENNDKYKVDCREELCLPEDNVWSRDSDTEPVGNIEGTTDQGSVIITGGQYVVFTFDGGIAPKGGLNSLIFTVNPEEYKRVVDVILTPSGGSKENTEDYESCGDVSAAKQQVLRKVIQTKVAFVEVGPVCLDPHLQYDVQILYRGVQPPNSDRIYPETSGINVVIESVNIALPLDPVQAFPDNEEAANIWKEYVGAQCPRLSAGYREPVQLCKDYLADLHNVVHNVAAEQCQVTVCIDNTAGWKHDPVSETEVFTGGADVSGGSTDAVIQIPPGGDVSIKTGKKDSPVSAAENVPYTGVLDLLISHKKSRYAWNVEAVITHTKTKGDVIPTSFTCGNGEVQPFSAQRLRTRIEACTEETLIPGVCIDKANTYSIRVEVLRKVGAKVQCEGAVATLDGFPMDKVTLAFPQDPEIAFPEDQDLQNQYREYLDNNCQNRRNKACDNLDIGIIASLVGEAVVSPTGCGCDSRGSVSGNCESVGGQCYCKVGYTGRQCNFCEPGYFGINEDEMCRPCDCNEYGSKSEICSSRGQCSCHEGVLTSAERAGLLDCSQCIDGYVGLENMGIEGCVECQCGVGAALPNCDESTGSCTCLPGVAEPLCNECSTGFYNLVAEVGCEACGCDSAGSSDLGCDQFSGVCHCKDNVIGTLCDSCKPNSFALSASNPAGCMSCHCHGVTDDCTSANNWMVEETSLQLDWTVVGGAEEKRSKYTIGAIQGTEFIWRVERLGDYYNSYSLQLTVLLSGHDESEVLLRLYRGEEYVTGTLEELEIKTLSVNLFEHNFQTMRGRVADVDTFRYILSDITAIEITTVYQESRRHDQKIKGFTMETVRKTRSGARAALHVEQCLCPVGYRGHACGNCQDGFAKVAQDGDTTFRCEECSVLCNGYSDQCDPESGICSNCSGNTVGDHCDVCQDGFYPVSEQGGLVCAACPCSRNAASPSCSLVGDGTDGPVCDECENGYTGPNCLECAPGFWGNGGQCTACECNDNIDLSDPYSCNKEDGVCQNCLYDTTGAECELCLPGYFGNALRPLRSDQPKCEECGCDPLGALSSVCDNFSGLCDCLPHVTGNKCDRCTSGYWNVTAEEGCSTCDCDMRGSSSNECDMINGQCQCEDGIQGRRCDECRAGFYNSASDEDLLIECTDCSCNSQGSESEQCGALGQCECKEGVIGMNCDRCARGTTGTFPDCTPCGECYDVWEEEVVEIEGQIEELASRAQNVHLGAANLTEGQLQQIFGTLRDKLSEAERLARSAPTSEDEVRALTVQLQSLSEELAGKSGQLDLLNQRISTMDQNTEETLAAVDGLKEKLEDFRVATDALAESAMTLSAANLDEALRLVEDAAQRSAQAQAAAEATKAVIEEADLMAKKAERILSDPIFRDTSSVEKIVEMEEELQDLAGKLDELDSSVCGTEEAGSCEPCGGSACGTCGGDGCGGAVGIVNQITGLAQEARSCADTRQDDVTDATSELRELNTRVAEIQASVDNTQQVGEEARKSAANTEGKLSEMKTMVKELLSSDRATAQDIEDIIEEINSLSLPLTETQLAALIDQLTAALRDVNLVNTDLEVSLPDRRRLAVLLDRAAGLESEAASTLEDIVGATEALREFDEAYNVAQDLLQETSGVVNQGWSAIDQIDDNRRTAEVARDGLTEDLDSLDRELQLLLADISSGDSIAQRAQAEIERATRTVSENSEQGSRLRANYDALGEDISSKEDQIADQIEESREGADLSAQVESSVSGKLAEAEQLTERFVVQSATLVDLNHELDQMERTLDATMERIQAKATYHAQCKNDIAS